MDKSILQAINHYKNATHCDRCGCVLNGVKFMSIFTTECLCKSCKNDEKNNQAIKKHAWQNKKRLKEENGFSRENKQGFSEERVHLFLYELVVH